MWEAFVKFIHNISDWLEAIGFVVGIITVIKVYFINKDVKKLHLKHLFQVRIDDHIEDLKNSAKRISKYLNDFPRNLKEIKLEISKCIEHCNSISKKVASTDLSNLKPLMKKMKKIRDNKIEVNSEPTFIQNILRIRPISQSEVDTIYTQLSSLITEIEQPNNDLKKSLK